MAIGNEKRGTLCLVPIMLAFLVARIPFCGTGVHRIPVTGVREKQPSSPVTKEAQEKLNVEETHKLKEILEIGAVQAQIQEEVIKR